jgi:hypothetical protein
MKYNQKIKSIKIRNKVMKLDNNNNNNNYYNLIKNQIGQ